MVESKYLIGFDIGSETVHSVVLDGNKIVYAPKSKMHFGSPGEVVKEILREYEKKEIGFEQCGVGFTGNGGRIFAQATNLPYFFDTLTIPLGAHFIMASAKYIFHMGAKDPYFFEKSEIGKTKVFVPDNSAGTKCGGGSGIMLTKQSKRLFSEEVDKKLPMQEQLEKMYELALKTALKSDKEIVVGGRCGVVIQSDMIHHQNSGESVNNILKGLYQRIAENYKNDVVRIRKLDKNTKAIATGGVSFNNLIIKALEKDTGLKINRPEHFEKVGAIGAALWMKDSKNNKTLDIKDIDKVLKIEKENVLYAPALKNSLKLLKIFPEKESKKVKDLKIFESGKREIPVVMGVDGGSTTTKAVLLKEKNLEPVAEICIETHGRPLQAAQNVFKQIKGYFKDRLDIKAVAYTGSSGGFYYRLFTKNFGEDSSDMVIDEITCHALGVRHFNKNVDTIFELGGQDAKFTLFEKKGTVKKAKMNLSCMAGTGQTMQNMIEMIGMNFEEFEEYSLKAKRTPVVDETCGVFTEDGIAKLVSLRLPKEEIAAAIAYGFIGGYINKFVGSEKFGKHISAQGGPFRNKAALAALAAHTSLKINAFPHRQLFGAYGAAIAAHKRLREDE
jgi:activator of 2-hydroxyglutaryl-CoA dehydratase